MLFGGTWLWHLHSVSRVIPLDNIEEFVWVRSLEWGYFKHPPLTTWLLWPFVRLFGLDGQVSTFLGSTLTLTSIGLMWSIARRAGGNAFGMIALLASLCVTFYNGRLWFYNHNVLMMFWGALSACLFLQILCRPRMAWWGALGVVGGLAMLSKYQYALLALPMAAEYLRRRLWTVPVHRHGLLLALLLAMLLFSPHLYWLAHQQQGPIEYAIHSSLGHHAAVAQRISGTLTWVTDWLLNRCLPGFITIGLCWFGMRSRRTTTQAPAHATQDAHAARAILLWWGFAPLALMMLLSLSSGLVLQPHWGTAFALWTIPAAMCVLRLDTGADADARLWRWLALPFVAMQATLLLVSYETSAYGRFASSARTWRQFPAHDIASALDAAVHAQLGRPVGILVGTEKICGALSLELPGHPKVLIDGKINISPWIDARELASMTKIWVWEAKNAPADSHPLPYGLRWSS